jgi:glycosyltransferase involved in cell wall biosynthesis
MELSVVIPAYNEGQIVRGNLDLIDDYLQTLGFEYEIIVVNDGSSDDTLKQVTALSKKHISIISYTENKGKGFAVNRGMMASHGRYRLFMDMDLSTELTEIPKFLQCVRDGRGDICVGNRNSIKLWAQKRPWHRTLLGKIFAFLSSVTSGFPLEDFTCGFKMFTAQACEQVFPYQSIYNWAFDTELISIAHQRGLRIHQEPVAWHHHDNSKVCIGQASIVSLMSLVKIYLNRGKLPIKN